MAIDIKNKTYKYTVNANGDVTYIAGADGKAQNLSERDTSSLDALETDLAQYTQDYIAGLSMQVTTVDKSIVVGVQKTADADVVLANVTPVEG